MTVGSSLRWPNGLMPPSDVAGDPLGDGRVAHLDPLARRARAPTAFSDSWQLTGTMATARSPPSAVTSSVLNTWSGSRPSAVAASSP